MSRPPLPTSSQGGASRASVQRWKYFRRIFKFQQMDFEMAMSQMFYLCVSPQRVYREFYYHKRTKNQWARDDPAFLVLMSLCLCFSSAGLAVVFGLSFVKFLQLLLWVVFVDYIATGMIVGTILWFLANRYLKGPSMASFVDQSVEWGYAFDVHCNAFFPLLLILHVLQLFLIKVIAQDWFISAFVSDTLWLVAISYYIYITYLGYKSLPFLKGVEVLLYPVAVVLLLYIVGLSLRWNVSMWAFRWYGFENPNAWL